MKMTRKQYRTKQNIKRNAYDLVLGFEQVFCLVLDVLILLSGFVTIVSFAGAFASYSYIGVLWCFVFILEFALFLGLRYSCYQDIKADLDEKNKKENKDNQKQPFDAPFVGLGKWILNFVISNLPSLNTFLDKFLNRLGNDGSKGK